MVDIIKAIKVYCTKRIINWKHKHMRERERERETLRKFARMEESVEYFKK